MSRHHLPEVYFSVILHFLYLFVIFGTALLLTLLLRKKADEAKLRAIHIFTILTVALYIADFFLMPFAYGGIDIEKLPFHACTATCVLCVLARHNRFLGRFKDQFLLLGLLTNLIYVIYPAGVGWYQIHPLSYRVWQTLLYHGAMTAFGLFSLCFGEMKLEWRKCPRDLAFLCVMTVWALLGNTLYNGLDDRFFNWFFVVRDPFYILPEGISPFVMPAVMVAVMFTGEVLIRLVCTAISRLGSPLYRCK